MPTTSERITNEIVNVRAKHLPKIKDLRSHLKQLKEKVDDLANLLKLINTQVENKQGEYYELLKDEPQMQRAISSINIKDLIDSEDDSEKKKGLLSEQLYRINLLEKRFSRNTIRLAFIGRERQGKSTFLQTISGLSSDKVIPAYEGTSCTGAVSVIHNIDGSFRAEIELYSIKEFLDVVITKLQHFFKNHTFVINSIEDLVNLNLPERVSAENEEYRKFKKAYITNLPSYINILQEHGGQTLTEVDESKIVQYVAQYEKFVDTPPADGCYDKLKVENGKNVYIRYYYKYVIVKNVDIFNRFESTDTRLIELVDTIGLGDASNKKTIEESMYKVLNEDCDVAIDLFKPHSSDSFNTEQVEILNGIKSKVKDPYKWIVYVINKVMTGPDANNNIVDDMLDDYNGIYGDAPEEQRPAAWAKIIDGRNFEDVKGNLISPILELIIQNLPDIDKRLMDEAQEKGSELYLSIYNLCENIESVISGAVGRAIGEGELFDEKMEELMNSLSAKLNNLEKNVYLPLRNLPQENIKDHFDLVITSLDKSIPRVEEIKKTLETSFMNSSEVFNYYCDELINNVVKEFEKVSEDVIDFERDKVIRDMALCLYEGALFKNISLKGFAKDKLNFVESEEDDDEIANEKVENSKQWLKALLSQKINKSIYPNLYDAINYSLAYQEFNLGHTIEYDITECLSIIDKLNNDEFIAFDVVSGSLDEQSRYIYTELDSRLRHLRDDLQNVADRFSKIPSHSFYARVSKYVLRLGRNEGTKRDLRKFCRNNMYSLWGDELMKIEIVEKAFGRWNILCQDLRNLCAEEDFILYKDEEGEE